MKAETSRVPKPPAKKRDRKKGGKKDRKKDRKDSVTDGPCKDGVDDICNDFMQDVVVEWTSWMTDASQAYTACCTGTAPQIPAVPTIDCDYLTEFRDLCRLFRDWAKEVKAWALKFGKKVDTCFSAWTLSVPVPRMPTGQCMNNCGKLLTQIRIFHLQLAAWAEDVRYPLNELCTAPPGRVPPPPEPPFE